MASRKKSTAGTGPNGGIGPQVDNSGGNTLLKKAGQQAPLYQQCTAITSRLSRIPHFKPWLVLTVRTEGSSRRSTDPVQALWDCLALGAPLCFVFNHLELAPDLYIPLQPTPDSYDVADIKACKKYTANFIMALTKLKNTVPGWEDVELFTIGELLSEPRNTNGFVKVVSALRDVLDNIPEEVFSEPLPAQETPELGAAGAASSQEDLPIASSRETGRKYAVHELIDSERRFVADLEILQNYASELKQNRIVSPDIIHELVLNVNELLDNARRVLIAMEGANEQPWREQRWGNIFITFEESFAVFEPYCANFQHASKVLVEQTETLMALANVLNPRNEVSAFLIKPVQRIMKYPLLIKAIIDRTDAEDYPLYDELLSGLKVAERLVVMFNEAERRTQNLVTCKALEKRVVDWKGHHISGFGLLRLDDLFTVNKSEVDRDYHVFLFERIILCCKEAGGSDMPYSAGGLMSGSDQRASIMSSSTGGRKSTSKSILSKKNSIASVSPHSGQRSNLSAHQRSATTPLLLKGRIFLSNVTKAAAIDHGQDAGGGRYGLEVWWRGDDELEFFTLRCRSEEQMKMWETSINGLVYLESEKQKAEKKLRQAERASASAAITSRSSSSASLAPKQRPVMPLSANSVPHYSHQAQIQIQNQSSSHHQSLPMPHGRGPSVSSTGGRNKDLSKYFGASQIPVIAAPPQGPYNGDDGNNQATEDEYDYDETYRQQPSRQQYRSEYAGGGMPGYPRSASALGGRHQQQQQQQLQQPGNRPALRSQFSSVRLDSAYADQEEEAQARVRAVTTPGQNHLSQQHLGHPYAAGASIAAQQQYIRMRSASTPTAFGSSQAAPPPLPRGGKNASSGLAAKGTAWSATASSSSLTDTAATTTDERRGSGSSQYSTGSHQSAASSGYSTNDQGSLSPLTPYGSSDSNIAGIVLKGSTAIPKTPTPSSVHHRAPNPQAQMVKIKVHYRTDLFIISVPRTPDYASLAEKVARKIRLCGGDRDPDAPVKIKYRDEDGDLISLGSDDDVAMAFDTDAGLISLWVA